MGGDVYKLIALLAVVVGVGAVAYYLRSNRCGQKPGIISEDINGSGDNWSADFRARVSAPEQEVFRALGKVENAKSDQILDIKVLSDLGSTKLVEVDFAGPTGSSVPTQFRFEFFSSQDRLRIRASIARSFRLTAIADSSPNVPLRSSNADKRLNSFSRARLLTGLSRKTYVRYSSRSWTASAAPSTFRFPIKPTETTTSRDSGVRGLWSEETDHRCAL
jgi:hypothetical protein